MADRRRSSFTEVMSRTHRAGSGRRDRREALTASTMLLDSYNTQQLVIQPNEWQREAWGYYKSIGELNFGIGSWLANALSRIRLVAAQRVPGSDDPTQVTDGPIADIVTSLGGGLAGQAAMLRRMAVHISVPGDSYLVTEDQPIPGGYGVMRTATTYSNSEIRLTGRGPNLSWQVNTQRQLWRPLAPEALVSRVWWPDEEYAWRSTSPVEAALPILREIDMYNRYIVAVLLSRVASNGLLLVPDEVTFPVKPQFKDAADPFMAELIEAGQRNVKNPGTAGAAFPLSVKVPAAMIEKFRLLTFSTEMGKKVLEDRDRALHRLAGSLNMPLEALEGMGNTSHWNAWQIDEAGVKIHIAPIIEVIVDALTKTFLAPMAAAANVPLYLPDGSEYIIWYDPSALIQQPDRSKEAGELYDRGELGGEALRRETGFDDKDKPDATELRNQILLNIAMKGGPDAMAAASVLLNDPTLATVPQRVTVTAPDPSVPEPDVPAPGPAVDKGPPPAPEAPAPTPTPAKLPERS